MTHLGRIALLLLATFTEADVVAGNPISGKARLRLLVNQATGRRE